MNNSLSETARLDCESLLWIGDSEHHELRAAWRVCQRLADTICIRRSLADAIRLPPRRMPTHLIVAQTNRHDRACAAIDGDELSQLQVCFPKTKLLVLRGVLVAPTVRLPPNSRATPANNGPPWVDSISVDQSECYLPQWLASPDHHDESWALVPNRFPVVMVAARYCFAESYLDSLRLLAIADDDANEPLIQWQRELTTRSSRGFATVLWDESAAPPATGEVWQQRCQLAPQATHRWMSAMATPRQREIAIKHGVDQVLNKSGRLSLHPGHCLLRRVEQAIELQPT